MTKTDKLIQTSATIAYKDIRADKASLMIYDVNDVLYRRNVIIGDDKFSPTPCNACVFEGQDCIYCHVCPYDY